MAEKTAGGQEHTDTATKTAGDTTLTGAPAPSVPAPKPAEAAPAAATKTPEQTAADQAAADTAAAAAKKATDDAAAEAQRKADEAAASTKAPETYALTIPDGAKEWLDDGDLKAIEKIARARNLSNEDAQALIDEHADTLAAQSAAFRAATEADETYGGDHLAETQQLARLALDRVRPAGTPRGDNLRRLLARSGYGNNVEIVSFLADLGKLMREDSPTSGGGGGVPQKDAAAVLYGSASK